MLFNQTLEFNRKCLSSVYSQRIGQVDVNRGIVMPLSANCKKMSVVNIYTGKKKLFSINLFKVHRENSNHLR